MADVFVSYAASDRGRVEPLVKSLIDAGLSVWWDNRIGIGSSFDREIETQLEQAHCVVVFWTEDSVHSDWVSAEADEGYRRGILVPVCLDDVRPPLAFRRAQSAIFYDESKRSGEHQKLLAAIHRCLPESENPPVPRTENLIRKDLTPPARRTLKTVGALSGIAAAGIVGYLGYWSLSQPSTVSSPAQLIEHARTLVAEDKYIEAFVLLHTNKVQKNETTENLWKQIEIEGIPGISTAGVSVSYKPYFEREMAWIEIGETPFAGPVLLPKGALLLRLGHKDRDALEVVALNPGPMFGNYQATTIDDFGPSPQWDLTQPAHLGSDMVVVAGSQLPMFHSGYPGLQPLLNTSAFAISRSEVTNEEFQAFIRDGGYEEPSFWSGLRFIREGVELSFDDARKFFVDQTNRLGPATWELGSYQEGEARLPVGGLSWYEAVAYSRYRQALLPTVHHWIRAAFGPLEPFFPLEAVITRDSNFASDGPIPTSSPRGTGPWGTVNTAGNVREWVWNATDDHATIMGGSWRDYGEYSAVTTVTHFDRRDDNGIRLMQRLDTNEIDLRLLAPVTRPFNPELIKREPVSDETFSAFKLQFSAPHRVPLRTNVSTISSSDLYTVEEHVLEFNDNESLTVYFFVPDNARHPLQPILFAPTSDALQRMPNRNALQKVRNFDYILAGGRAIVFPIWDIHYERANEVFVLPDTQAQAERERSTVLSWYRDSLDVIDYLESLNDYDASSLSIFGISIGAASLAPILLATEPRIKSAILMAGGTYNDRPWHPFADPINYAPHITQPVLMLSGQFDNFFPLEISTKRLFNLLGTPNDEKKLVLFDGGHVDWPRNRKVTEVSDWLDAHMGPTR